MGDNPEGRGSLFAAMSEGLASREQTARLQRLEVALGFLSFFTLVSLIATVAAELSGRAAIAEALVSAVMVAVTYWTYRNWRNAGRRVAAQIAERRNRYDARD